MNSRDAILSSLRRNAPPESPLPEVPTAITYADPERQFAETFGSVGGTPFASPVSRRSTPNSGTLRPTPKRARLPRWSRKWVVPMLISRP